MMAPIESQGENLKRISTTGYGTKSTSAKCLEVGFQKHLTKTRSICTLETTIALCGR